MLIPWASSALPAPPGRTHKEEGVGGGACPSLSPGTLTRSDPVVSCSARPAPRKHESTEGRHVRPTLHQPATPSRVSRGGAGRGSPAPGKESPQACRQGLFGYSRGLRGQVSRGASVSVVSAGLGGPAAVSITWPTPASIPVPPQQEAVSRVPGTQMATQSGQPECGHCRGQLLSASFLSSCPAVLPCPSTQLSGRCRSPYPQLPRVHTQALPSC